MADDGTEPFVGLNTESQLGVRKCCDVVPLIGDLAFVNASHEFECRNCVFTGFTVEIRKFDDLSFHGDIGVGLNLPCELSSTIVSLNCGLLL